MNKIKLYHCCSHENLRSIFKYGLITSKDNKVIHFSNDQISCISFLNWRNELRDKKKVNKLGLVVFETTIGDPYLSVNLEFQKSRLNFLNLQGTQFHYKKIINRDELTFHTVKINEDLKFVLSDFNLDTYKYLLTRDVINKVYQQTLNNKMFYDFGTNQYRFMNEIDILPDNF